MTEERALQATGNLRETVDLLSNVAGGQPKSQHALARHLGVSVGLVNALIRRAVRKGLIKVKQAPARRYAYYLTPQGFAEKSRLVAEYMDFSLSFFRKARGEYAGIFAICQRNRYRRVLLCGAGELAEIAGLAAGEADVELIGVLDAESSRTRINGLPVLRDLGELGHLGDVGEASAACAVDCIVLTDCRDPQASFERLSLVLDPDRILAPTFLRVTRRPAGE